MKAYIIRSKGSFGATGIAVVIAETEVSARAIYEESEDMMEITSIKSVLLTPGIILEEVRPGE